MKIILNGLFFLFLFNYTFSQSNTFERYYSNSGAQFGNCVQQTFDGGYIIVGMAYSSVTAQDVILLKVDSTGNTIWTKIYGGPNTDAGFYIEQTPDSGYIVVAEKDLISTSNSKIWLMKMDVNGDTTWTQTITAGIGANVPSCVRQTSDRGYVITGYTSAIGAGSYDVYLVKTDSTGDILWAKTFGGANADIGNSVQQTSDSGYIITGNTGSFGAGGGDVYLIKTNANGDSVWTKTFGDTSGDIGESVQQTFGGGFVIGGITWNLSLSKYNTYLIKTDSLGDTLWTAKYGETSGSYGYSVEQTRDGGFIMAGVISIQPTNIGNVFLIKTNSTGDTLWTKTFGGADPDNAYFVRQTREGGYILVGSTASFTPLPGSAIYLIKTDSLGSVVASVSDLGSNDINISVFPNPSNGRFIIECRNKEFKIQNIEIYSLLGERVYLFQERGKEEKYESGITFDITDKPAGVYLLNIRSENRIVTKKIIINPKN